MRTSSHFMGPLILISGYYGLLIALVWLAVSWFPGLNSVLPFGGLDALSESGTGRLDVITDFRTDPFFQGFDALTLALAISGAVLLMLPTSWVYFMTTRRKQIDRSFVQTVIVLPVVVAGIAVIVQNSLALAFSLAGIVAAVRFRFTLTEPAYALYIFTAIAVGLGAGVGALGVSFVVSVAFVYINLILWRINYGADLTTPFFAFLTGRGVDDDELQ
ncbi:MAG: DUF4956 domain-containing protein [Pseudomonadota bacterium]